MQARFHALGKQRDEIMAKAAPLRIQYEALRAEECALRERMKPIVEAMKTAETPLYDIDAERGMICRALNGRTGEPG